LLIERFLKILGWALVILPTDLHLRWWLLPCFRWIVEKVVIEKAVWRVKCRLILLILLRILMGYLLYRIDYWLVKWWPHWPRSAGKRWIDVFANETALALSSLVNALVLFSRDRNITDIT
jgi:hypothetical protein